MADIMAKTIKFPGLNNTYEFMQPDGSYPNLTAGNIISNDAYNEDTEPYLFRALPYKSKRLEEELVGGAVNWNQLARADSTKTTPTGITFTRNDLQHGTLSGTATGAGAISMTINFNYVANHKLLVTANATLPTGAKVTMGGLPLSGNAEGIVTYATSISTFIRVDYVNGVQFNDVEVIPKIIDLNQFFGNATIADAIYAMETANAGSGVTFMRKYFPKLFDAEYDTGTLKSVNPTSHKMVGVNQWDEEWESGGFNSTTGAKTTDANRIRSKNLIPIIGTETYYINSPYSVTGFFYDADKNYLGYASIGRNVEYTPSLSQARYMNFTVGSSSVPLTTYNHDICINISDPTINGQYFPYEEHTYDLGNVPLYGLFQLVDNKLKAYGDVRHAVGGTDRKFTLVDLGTLVWTYMPNGDSATGGLPYFYSSAIDNRKPSANMVCEKYAVTSGGRETLTNNSLASFNLSNNTAVCIADSSYTDAATLKTALNGVYLLYEKATTTTEDTPSFEKIQSCFPYGTEEYITTNGVPVGHETKYFKDVISTIAGIPEPPSGNGTYELKLTVTDGVASYSWVAV